MPTGSGTSLQNNLNGTDTKMSSEDLSGSNNGHSNGNSKLPTVSYDHTPYVQRARVTRPAPPKPSANPLQFVQIKPCNLYQSAQEQLKRAEEVKKVKEIKKEEPEDWQNNLDNWKSSRRKRVEHIIDRVVEVKKLELEEHDRTRRKSKTFSEMMEEKKTKRSTKLAALVYTEEESNDLSDLGIGTSSASGKSSLSEDYDNQSVMSDNVDNDKHSIDLDHPSQNHDETNGSTNRDYMSSPGYDTSSSTAPASSPDPCEYTYEGAIEDYKTRISKASQITTTYNNGFRSNTTSDSYSKDSTPERQTNSSSINHPPVVPARRTSAGTKIENRLMSFEIKSACDLQSDATNSVKKSLPKVDILKRRELFEKENSSSGIQTGDSEKRSSSDFSNSKSIKERLSNLEKIKVPAECGEDTKPTEPNRRLSGDLPTIRGRLQILEKQNSQAERKPKIEVPVGSLKDRLSSLHTAATKEEAKKPVMLIDARQLEILKEEDLIKQHQMGLLKANHRSQSPDIDSLHISHEILKMQEECNLDTDREDSGIHTTDVSCSVSQTDEQPELSNEESAHHINANDGLCDPEESVCLQLTTAANPIPDEFVPVKPIPTARTHINTNILSETITVIEQPSAASPEPLNDLDASVSQSLSESTTSSRTILFDGESGGDSVQLEQDELPNQPMVEEVLKKSVVPAGSFNGTNINETSTAIILTPSSPSFKNTKNEFTNIDHSTNNVESICIGKDATVSSMPISPKDRRKTVIEICEKRNVGPDAVDHIPTPFIDISYADVGQEKPVIKSKPVNILQDVEEVDLNTVSKNELTSSNASDTINISINPQISEQSQDLVSEESGVVMAELEVITTEITVRPAGESPTSPRINPSTHPLAAKPKNIFDFIKKNFNGPAEEIHPVTDSTSNSGGGGATVTRRDTIKIDNSKFYIPSDSIDSSCSTSTSLIASPISSPPLSPNRNEVNIQITKTIKTDKIMEKTDSVDSTNTMTSEINQLLDEELAKLTIEDTRM